MTGEGIPMYVSWKVYSQNYIVWFWTQTMSETETETATRARVPAGHHKHHKSAILALKKRAKIWIFHVWLMYTTSIPIIYDMV